MVNKHGWAVILDKQRKMNIPERRQELMSITLFLIEASLTQIEFA